MNNDVYEIVKQRLKELEEPQRLLPPSEDKHLEWAHPSQLASSS